MKDYKSDENLNYADLSGGSIGEIEGYGPCRSSFCNGCSCPLSSCSCRTDESFIKLWSICPAIDCEGRGTSQKPSHWFHTYDNEYTWMSTQARIRCQGCGTVDHMTKWRFRCAAHRHDGNKNPYREVGRNSFYKALAWTMLMEKDSSTSETIRQINKWIDGHPNEWDIQ